MVKLIQMLFATFIVNQLGLTFVLGRSLLAENSKKTGPLRDQNTRRNSSNHERMSRDVVATILDQGKLLRHLQRFKRNDHPCVQSKRVATYGKRRYAVASCYASINTGCFAAALKYSTPLCMEIRTYLGDVGKAITTGCTCKI